MSTDQVLRQLQGLKSPQGYDGKLERMARALRLDLESSVKRGDVSLAGVHVLMKRCAACGDKQGCRLWLNVQRGVAEEPYSMCMNSKALKSLRQQARKRR